MQISSRFTIALHIFTCVNVFENDYKITSNFLANSINVNPVIIRNILTQLVNYKLIEVKRGSGGIKLLKEPKDITFYDVYMAVESVGENTLFHFHENPNPKCPVGRNIHKLLDEKLDTIQQAMENQLKKYNLMQLFNESKIVIK